VQLPDLQMLDQLRDHLVGVHEQQLRDHQAERFGSFEVDD
jgi:hypothetical protein